MILTTLRLLLLLCCTEFCSAMSTTQQTIIASCNPTTLRFLSYNVRYDSMPDNISLNESLSKLPTGVPEQPSKYYHNLTEQPWSTRRHYIANDILFNNVDIYGTPNREYRFESNLHNLQGVRNFSNAKWMISPNCSAMNTIG